MECVWYNDEDETVIAEPCRFNPGTMNQPSPWVQTVPSNLQRTMHMNYIAPFNASTREAELIAALVDYPSQSNLIN